MVAETEVPLAEKRLELEALLRSKDFARSPALARLLEYLCEKTFTGRIYEIKEFSIATEVFGRSEDFSEKRDSLVRVEVHRLRKKLQNHYKGEGSDRPVHIVIRPGNYTPEFERISSIPGTGNLPVSTPSAPLEPAPPGARGNWFAVGALIAAALMLAVAQIHLARPGPSTSGITARPAVPGNGVHAVRILAGAAGGNVVDRFGNEWQADRYFSGGFGNLLKFGSQNRAVRRPAILGTPDQTPFRTFRSGDFAYAIPLAPGKYELRLYFSEVVFGMSDSGDGAENQRVFDVALNGKALLQFHDIYSDAGGPDRADIHVFENVEPARDGKLHLEFCSLREAAWLNAIELIPNPTGRPLPVRIVAQNTNYTDSRGKLWQSDRYFVGGRATSDDKTVLGGNDSDLFAAVRYGHFSYRIPVAAAGKYTVRLYFAETFFGPGNRGNGGVGNRLFNVYCSGEQILRNFDIFREAGANRSLVKVFRGVSPNPEGRIDLTFEPVVNYAVIYAIELEPEAVATSG